MNFAAAASGAIAAGPWVQDRAPGFQIAGLSAATAPKVPG
jgi:hypothetical protein